MKMPATSGIEVAAAPDQKETPPYLLKSLNEGRAGRNADDGDEGVQADVVHEPQRRLRDIAHVGITGMEPTAKKAGDQHAAAHRKAQRHGPDTGHQQPAEEQSAQKDAQPHQRHPRLFRDRIAEPERRRGAAHVLRQADQFEPVAGIELAAGQHRNLHAGTQDRTDIHTVHFFPFQNIAHILPRRSALAHHHGQALHREVRQLRVLDLRTDPILLLDHILTAAAHHERIAGIDRRAGRHVVDDAPR